MEMDFELINKKVEVAAVFRVGGDNAVRVMPVKMKYRARDIVFTELGLRHPTVQGRRMLHVFDMSDGTSNYRLELDAESLSWTLVTILEHKS